MSNIFEASENGDLLRIKQLLVTNNGILKKLFSKPNINSTNEDGQTPLFLASINNHLLLVRYLLSQNADTEIRDNKEGATALIGASCKGFTNVVDTLLQNGATVDATDKFEQTSLWHASYDNHLSVVKALISHKANVNKWHQNTHSTPLFVAAQEGNYEVVSLLLQNGADVDIGHIANFSPLHRAVRSGYNNIVLSLLQYKANVNAKDSEDNTPLSIACLKGFSDIVTTLIQNGANVHAFISERTTPLHIACWHGQEEIVSLLLSYRVDINSRDKAGASPLLTACAKNNLEVVRILERSGADINSRNNKKYTALHIAALKGNLDIVKYLTQNHAKVLRNMYGKTALDIAIGKQFSRIVVHLEQYGRTVSHTETEEDVDTNSLNDYVDCMELEIKDMKNIIKRDPTRKDKLLHLSGLENAVSNVAKKINENMEENRHSTKTEGKRHHDPLDIRKLWKEISNIGKEISKEGDIIEEAPAKDLSDKHLLQVALKIANDWKTIAGCLEVDFTHILELASKYDSDPVFAAWHMLISWRDMKPGDLNKQRKSLTTVMEKCERKDLLNTI